MTAPTLPATMTVWRQDRYGTAATVTSRAVPTPAPGRGEVLVRTEAVSINSGDIHLMQGSPRMVRLFFGLRFVVLQYLPHPLLVPAWGKLLPVHDPPLRRRPDAARAAGRVPAEPQDRPGAPGSAHEGDLGVMGGLQCGRVVGRSVRGRRGRSARERWSVRNPAALEVGEAGMKRRQPRAPHARSFLLCP